jgi:hypothetical protein
VKGRGMAVIQRVVREIDTDSVPAFRKRVYRLAAIYSAIVLTGIVAIAVVLIWGKFFVTLSQRSNVETLTLAFILVLFAYFVIICLPGLWGTIKIVYYNFPAWFGGARSEVEARKQAAVTFKSGIPDFVYLNCRVCRQGHPHDVVMIPLRDDAGSLGSIVIDGVKMTHKDGVKHSSNSLFAFFEQRIQQLIQARDPQVQVEIVQWATINNEPGLQYESLVAFSRNLEKHLDAGPLWPAVELTDEDIATLTHEATELCPLVRNETHLPDLEYELKHQLPIIPEPLAFVSLSRQEQRADPEAAMGCALMITIIILAILVLFIFFPPWVPGK